MTHQTTLAGPAVCAGVGLHSGARARMTLRPAPADTGVVFRRVDLKGADNVIPLAPDAVTETRLGTTIANGRGASVATTEHFLAAVVGLGVDNLVVDIDGPEVPAMDGSAAPFARLIARAGLERLAAPRRVIRVLKPVEYVAADGRRARFEPAERPEIDIEIDFASDAVGRQRFEFAPDADTFADAVAPARTFAFASDVDALREAGLARGGSLENCVVIADGKVVNEEGLRFDDEFARHKALDALGDLALAGRAIFGRYVAERPGHAVNNAALRTLLADDSAWTLETLPAPAAPRHVEAEDRRAAASA
jgi:UDP-3-O-[3-hydroxymyristoyl] N-acetylglucosamine deacetylase